MNENWLGLDGQVVIVTGGASGIGKHVVDTLVKVGANAVAVDLNVKTGDELDGAYCVQCNVTDPESVNQMVQAVLEKYGKIDALVNNAGINLPRLLVDVKGEKPEYELNEDSFGKMFAVNVKGVFLCAQAVARELVKQGHGVILNMSSESGKEGSQGQSAYSATKGAVDSFTRSWAEELGKKLRGHDLVITEVSKKEKKNYAPELYDLTTLQKEASKRYGFSPKQTLNIVQSLYEHHKVLTYPRTDSRY